MRKINILKYYNQNPINEIMELSEDSVLFPVLPYKYCFKYKDKNVDDYIIISKSSPLSDEKTINGYYLTLVTQVVFLDAVTIEPTENIENYLGEVYIKHSLKWRYLNVSNANLEYIGISKITKFSYKGIEYTYLGVKDYYGEKDVIYINNTCFSEYMKFYRDSYCGNTAFIGDKIGNFKDEYDNILNNFFKKLVK